MKSVMKLLKTCQETLVLGLPSLGYQPVLGDKVVLKTHCGTKLDLMIIEQHFDQTFVGRLLTTRNQRCELPPHLRPGNILHSLTYDKFWSITPFEHYSQLSQLIHKHV